MLSSFFFLPWGNAVSESLQEQMCRHVKTEVEDYLSILNVNVENSSISCAELCPALFTGCACRKYEQIKGKTDLA